MKKVKVKTLIEKLCEIPDEDFHVEEIYQFLSENPLDIDSITKYLHWNADFYTRNLIYKDERFELMAVCWEKGQISKIHNHYDQMCWMTSIYGKLRGQNFKITEIDEDTGYCKLAETDMFDLSEGLVAKVELEEPIHQILNMDEFDGRAISIHIYSKPFENCLSYCRDTNTYKEIKLQYYSINGESCMNAVI